MDQKKIIKKGNKVGKFIVIVLYLSFTLINNKEEEKIILTGTSLTSITQAVMSLKNARDVKTAITKELPGAMEELDIKSEMVEESVDIKSSETKIIEAVVEDIQALEEKREIITAASRGVTRIDSRTETSDTLPGYLNSYVLDIIKTYTIGSENPYLLNNDYENYNGVTENIVYDGELLLKGHPSGMRYSHCTGITFEVFFKAMQQRNRGLGISVDDFNGMTKDELHDFILNWFVAKGSKEEGNLTIAIVKYGIGQLITSLEDAKPGDFIDLSRENNTGHAVIFINWIRKDNEIIGIRHWSSQGSTNGISYKEEYFNINNANGVKYGNVIFDSLNIARINPVENYKSFK